MGFYLEKSYPKVRDAEPHLSENENKFQTRSSRFKSSYHLSALKERRSLKSLKIGESDPQLRKNKTSIQWIPGSQIYLNSKKIFFDQK